MTLSDLSDSLPISLVRQFLFCPRIPWLRQNLHQEYRQPLWTLQGKAYEEKREVLLGKRPLFRSAAGINYRQKFNVAVENAKLRIHGQLDVVIETQTERIPVEIKLHAGKPTRGQILQLVGYGLCLEDQHYTVRRGIVVVGPRQRRYGIAFTPAIRQEFLQVLQKLRTSVEHPFLPASSASPAKCAQCEHQNLCQDRDFF